MSFIAGAIGSKTVFPDDAQIDHLSENTVGHGVRVKGITNPTAYPIIAGDIGEILTPTERAGVGGRGYQDYNTTAITNTGFTKMIYKSVNPGVYLVSGISTCYRSDSATAGELMSYIAVGGTAVTNTVYAAVSSNNSGSACTFAVVVINTNNTEIQVYSRMGSPVTAASPSHGLTIVRIA